MTVEQGVAFLEALRCKHIRLKDNGWIEASCPLAPWFHKHHTDHTPSFGLDVRPGARCYFLCFACRQGSVEELLASLEMYAKARGTSELYDFIRCRQILADEDHTLPVLPEYGAFGSKGSVFTEWPQYWVDSFIQAAWHTDSAVYLASRGIPVWQVAQFDLRFDPKRQMIVAPYRDVFGRLAGARGRSILPDPPQKHYDYSFQGANNARLCWFNEPVLNLPGPVVTVEGQFDAMRVSGVFPKVVAALSSKPTLEKLRKLGDCGTVVQIPDRDPAGHESVARYATLCQQMGLQHRVVVLDDGVKDPGECHPEYLRDKITEALGT